MYIIELIYCTAQSCNVSTIMVTNGMVMNETATTNNFGDVLKFVCNEGYEIVNGSSRTYCETDGTYSHQPPTCQSWFHTL